MKHLGVALIVCTAMVLDFLADLWIDGTADNHRWDVTVTWVLIGGVAWFAGHWGNGDATD